MIVQPELGNASGPAGLIASHDTADIFSSEAGCDPSICF